MDFMTGPHRKRTGRFSPKFPGSHSERFRYLRCHWKARREYKGIFHSKQEIKRLAEHNEQFRNELTCYQNSQVNVEIMLKKNVAYKRLFHYDWLRQDISEYLEEGKNKEEKKQRS